MNYSDIHALAEEDVDCMRLRSIGSKRVKIDLLSQTELPVELRIGREEGFYAVIGFG
jgi:hypothetical protein